MSNYPPGVTGNEFQIAGPDYEQETTARCEISGEDEPGIEQGYGQERWFICNLHEHQSDMTPGYEEQDPDRYDEDEEDYERD